METPDLMPPGWERGDRGLTTCAHDLVWTRRDSSLSKMVQRVQFDLHQGGYVFGVVGVDATYSRPRPNVAPATYRFNPMSPVFPSPQAAAVWATIEGLT
jgi:hypothetical protein